MATIAGILASCVEACNSVNCVAQPAGWPLMVSHISLPGQLRYPLSSGRAVAIIVSAQVSACSKYVTFFVASYMDNAASNKYCMS